MKIVENLSALALRQLIDGAPPGCPPPAAGELVKRLFTSHPERLRVSLTRICDQNWRALELALAGPNWWEQCRARLHPGEEPMLADKVKTFFNAPLLAELANLGPDPRQLARDELRAGRQAGLLSGELDRPGELARLLEGPAPAAETWLVSEVADELRQAFPALSELLIFRSSDGQLLLARLTRWLFLKAVTADAQLAADPGLAALPSLPAEQKAGIDALHDLLTNHAERLDALLAPFKPIPSFHDLELEPEAERSPESIQQLSQVVLRLLREHRLPWREMQPVNLLSISGEEARQRIRDVSARVHRVPEEMRRKRTALMHALAILEAAAGDLEMALRDLQTVASVLTDPSLQAVALFNAYLVALELRQAAVALPLLQAAANLDPKKFALFPLDKFEPERILGGEPSAIAFVCKHKASDTRVVVKSLWPDGLVRDIGDLFRETRMLEELNHPALVHLRECDFSDASNRRLPFVVTDFFDATSLGAHVRQHGVVPPDEMLTIARTLADALLTAHERGILHGDLKPGSVLVRKDPTGWRVKLIAFGQAPRPSILYATLGGPPTWSRTTLGFSSSSTLPYLAPEQIGFPNGAAVGPHSDIYSFGKLCYFALLGTADPDDEEKETLPTAWRKLLGQCTAKNVARRLPHFRAITKVLSLWPAGGQAPEPKAVAPTPASAPTAAPGPVDQELVQTYLSRGMGFKQQGDSERALAAFSKALQLEPKLTAGYIKRGNTYLDVGKFDQAIADYTEALKLDANNPAPYMNRGLAFTKKGDYKSAIADCGKAVELDPKLTAAYSIRAAAYWEHGERHRAIAEYNIAIRTDPNNALAFNGRGLAFCEQGDYDKAIRDFNQALKYEPRLLLAYVNRGNAYRLKNQFQQAIADLTRALKLDPKNLSALFNRGLALMARQSYDQAIADFDRVLQIDPKHPEVVAKREEAKQAKGKMPPPPPRPTGEQRPPVPRAPATPPPPPPKIPTIADQLKAKPAPEKPKAPAKSPEELAEEERRQMRAAAFFSRGRSLFEQRDFVQAIDQFSKAISVDPQDPVFHYNRGEAHIANDDFTEALADFSETLRFNPKNAMAYYQRGLAQRLLGKYDLAIADYTRAIKLDPRLALAYRHRSLAYAAKGDSERAKSDQERALRLDPHLAKEAPKE